MSDCWVGAGIEEIVSSQVWNIFPLGNSAASRLVASIDLERPVTFSTNNAPQDVRKWLSGHVSRIRRRPAWATLDALVAKHLGERGMSLHGSRDTRWLFPGGSPGRHLNTESIRALLVAIGMKPYEGRKATLFQLVADVPAAVLGELDGISNNNAADWARLAGRDWRNYIADRAR